MPTFEPRRIRGAWFRHVPAGADLLARRALAPDGRWQRGPVVEGLYVADTQTTAVEEWRRWLTEMEIPPRATLPRDLWRIELDVEVADLSTSERLAACDLPRPTPSRRSWGPFQEVGQLLYEAGWAGLVAPSAARPAGLVVCLFWRGTVMEGARPLPPPDRWDDPPAP